MKRNLLSSKLAIVLILLGFFVSCKTLPCHDCVLKGKSTLTLQKAPFSDTESALYRVSIKLYTMYFSGLLAVKKIEDGSFRMSLISETGFKLFDMEIINGVAEMKNVFGELDRDEVTKTFKEDFAMMVLSGFKSTECNRYDYEKMDEVLFECGEKNYISTNYMINQKTGILKKVWKAEEIEDQLFEINYGYPENGSMTPAFITIVHSNVRLRMEFSILETE